MKNISIYTCYHDVKEPSFWHELVINYISGDLARHGRHGQVFELTLSITKEKMYLLTVAGMRASWAKRLLSHLSKNLAVSFQVFEYGEGIKETGGSPSFGCKIVFCQDDVFVKHQSVPVFETARHFR